MLRRALSILLPLALASCDSDARPAPTDAGVPWELAELRRRTISDLTYDVHLTLPTERARPVMGETTVRFRWDDNGARDLVLDFLSPAARVRTVEANGQTVAWRAENDHVVVPAAALRAGDVNEVRLAYAAGDEALNRSDDFLYALFVPDRHHFSLPVFDQPNLKGRWRLTLTVPGDWTAVANGAEVEPADSASGGPRVFRFAETRPIPSYLFAFAAGRFEVETAERDGRALRMYHRETDAARVARNRDAIFDLHAHSLAWLEEYTGIAYPFDKFDFVLIPAFQYSGMEHPGAILYHADGLLLDESATQSDQLGRASVIAHETAHMWFGDLVTMNWFDDVWTKEVFANFMAAKIVYPSFPEVDHDLRFLVAHAPAAYGVDRTAGANAIRQELPNLREAGTLYGAIIYQKAPIVMRQLEERVGEEALRAGLREYLQTFTFGNATWPQLIEILDRRSQGDLKAWSRVWVDEPGRPTVRVEREERDGGVRALLRQEDPAGQGRVWPQRLEVAVPAEDGVRLIPVELGEGPVALDLAEPPAWILPNGGGPRVRPLRPGPREPGRAAGGRGLDRRGARARCGLGHAVGRGARGRDPADALSGPRAREPRGRSGRADHAAAAGPAADPLLEAPLKCRAGAAGARRRAGAVARRAGVTERDAPELVLRRLARSGRERGRGRARAPAVGERGARPGAARRAGPHPPRGDPRAARGGRVAGAARAGGGRDREPGPARPLRVLALGAVRRSRRSGALLPVARRSRQPRARAVGAGRALLSQSPAAR